MPAASAADTLRQNLAQLAVNFTGGSSSAEAPCRITQKLQTPKGAAQRALNRTRNERWTPTLQIEGVRQLVSMQTDLLIRAVTTPRERSNSLLHVGPLAPALF